MFLEDYGGAVPFSSSSSLSEGQVCTPSPLASFGCTFPSLLINKLYMYKWGTRGALTIGDLVFSYFGKRVYVWIITYIFKKKKRLDH